MSQTVFIKNKKYQRHVILLFSVLMEISEIQMSSHLVLLCGSDIILDMNIALFS